MRSRFYRVVVAAGLIAGGGFLMAGPGTSCASFAGESAFVATDLCFIFDCQNGILGGTIDPCGGGSGAQTVESGTQQPLFTDCPTGP